MLRHRRKRDRALSPQLSSFRGALRYTVPARLWMVDLDNLSVRRGVRCPRIDTVHMPCCTSFSSRRTNGTWEHRCFLVRIQDRGERFWLSIRLQEHSSRNLLITSTKIVDCGLFLPVREKPAPQQASPLPAGSRFQSSQRQSLSNLHSIYLALMISQKS